MVASDEKTHLGVQVRMDTLEEGRPVKYDHFIVEKYKEHFSFLRDSKFLQDLENDSVDSDIIEEELSALHEAPVSIREKVVKFLQSNPFQVLLCVIVLLDAGIVIAQILLDLNSVKDKLNRREDQLFQLIRHLKRTQADRLCGYPGFNVDRILGLLGDHDAAAAAAAGAAAAGSNCTARRRSAADRTAAKRPSKPLAPPTHDNNNNNNSNNSWTTAAGFSSGNSTASRDDDGGGLASVEVPQLDIEAFRDEMQLEHDVLHEVAHCLHFASIAILGFLVVEVLVKIAAMGKTFCKHKIEIFDAKIIIASFAIDIIFLGGVAGEEGTKAAAVLVILLLWRIARVVDGIVVTVKQRQEFRIRLQKRARRTAEKKMETFEEERHAKTKQIEALKDLCVRAGITDADIAACAPKHQRQATSALCALSSVARLSVSMTMLMSSGIYRPRLFEDALVLPTNVSGPMTKDASQHQQLRRHQSTDSHSGARKQLQQQQQQARDAAIPRIESLPIIQNSSSSQRGKQRKMAFIKAGRKNHEGYRWSYHHHHHHQPVIEAGEDGTSQPTATGEHFPDPEPVPPALLQQLASPVNRSGIDILIDVSSDVECNDADDDNDASKQTSIGADKDSDTRTDANGKSVCDDDDLLVDIEPVTQMVNLANQADVCEPASNSNAAQFEGNGAIQPRVVHGLG